MTDWFTLNGATRLAGVIVAGIAVTAMCERKLRPPVQWLGLILLASVGVAMLVAALMGVVPKPAP